MDKQFRSSSSSGKPSPAAGQTGHQQGIATLIVMITVLTIIILFCCFAAPGIRGMCRRYVFRTCAIDDPDLDNVERVSEEASPTVILLPYGRMLVVDRRVLSQLNPETRGMELMEITAGLVHTPREMSTPSILDSSETSKGLSPGLPPPSYEEVFPDFPPSYSEISLMMKNNGMEMIEMGNFKTGSVNEVNSELTVDGNMNDLREDTESPQESRDNNIFEAQLDNQNRTNNNC